MLRLKQGKNANLHALDERRIKLGLEKEEYNLNTTEENYKKAKKEWQAVVKEGQKIRETKLFDKNSILIEGEDKKAQNKRRKLVKKLKQAEFKKSSFKYITKHVGKGPNKLLNKLQIINEKGEITKHICNREEIESALIVHNIKHYRKAHASKAHNDRIY